MTYIILKKTNQWPKAWEKVCTLTKLYPNNGFLKEEYGLKDEDRISVRHIKRCKKPRNKRQWKGWRTPFKHVFNGTVKDFEEFCIKYYKDNVWSKIGERYGKKEDR